MLNPQILLHLQLGLEHSCRHLVQLDARLVMKHVATVIDLSAYVRVQKNIGVGFVFKVGTCSSSARIQWPWGRINSNVFEMIFSCCSAGCVVHVPPELLISVLD